MNNDHQDARMILALAAEADDRFIWDQVQAIQTEMFAAGPVQIHFAYFGAEGALATTRPYVSTRWVESADDMADLMDHGRAGCVCGCYIQIGDILEQALRETRQAPVQAVVIVEARDNESAVLLLEQMNAAGQIAQGTPQTDEA